MSHLFPIVRNCAAGVVLACSAFGAHAGFVTSGYFATQVAPAFPIDNPPAFNSGVMSAIANFNGATTTLGRQEFEGGSLDFNYTGGNATVAVSGGNPALVDGNLIGDSDLGRYNLTTGLLCLSPTSVASSDPNCDAPDRGKWLEANSSFTYTLTQAVSALAFFGTDFGDFNATVEIEFLFGGASVFRETIGTNDAGNGNLIFFGAVGETAADVFDSFRFNIAQFSGGVDDFLGFDSLILGTSNGTTTPPATVSTPSSLALAGLGLAVMVRFRRRLR